MPRFIKPCMIALMLAAAGCGHEEEDNADQATVPPPQQALPAAADSPSAHPMLYKDSLVQAPPMQEPPPGQPGNGAQPPQPPKPEKPRHMPKEVDFRK